MKRVRRKAKRIQTLLKEVDGHSHWKESDGD